MELVCYLKRMVIKAVVDWAPRSANYEADEQHQQIRSCQEDRLQGVRSLVGRAS